MPDATDACGCADQHGPIARVSRLPTAGAVPGRVLARAVAPAGDQPRFEQPAQGLA